MWRLDFSILSIPENFEAVWAVLAKLFSIQLPGRPVYVKHFVNHELFILHKFFWQLPKDNSKYKLRTNLVFRTINTIHYYHSLLFHLFVLSKIGATYMLYFNDSHFSIYLFTCIFILWFSIGFKHLQYGLWLLLIQNTYGQSGNDLMF